MLRLNWNYDNVSREFISRPVHTLDEADREIRYSFPDAFCHKIEDDGRVYWVYYPSLREVPYRAPHEGDAIAIVERPPDPKPKGPPMTDTRYRVRWTTADGHRHTTSARFTSQEDADRLRRLLLNDPAVKLAVVESVTVQAIL
jgi:hypothetical protein